MILDLLAAIGATFFICSSKILDDDHIPVRRALQNASLVFKDLISCCFCTGFWVGLGIWSSRLTLYFVLWCIWIATFGIILGFGLTKDIKRIVAVAIAFLLVYICGINSILILILNYDKIIDGLLFAFASSALAYLFDEILLSLEKYNGSKNA